MGALDPTNADGRILPCTRCQKPVVSSAWSGHVKLRCGYCNFEDERELVLAETSTDEARDPYRDAGKPKERTELPINLGGILHGHAMTDITWEKLRASFERRPLLDEHLASIEWERVWLGIWLGLQSSMRGDFLEARMALEATLEATRTPAYRALILAHLAQHAAARNAVPLAKKWLRARPDVAVAEVEAEVAAARAFILLAQGRYDEAIEKTGNRLAGAGYRGFSSFLASAINVEARERKGDKAGAVELVRELRDNKAMLPMNTLVAAHGIALEPLLRFVKKERVRAATRGGIIPAIVIAVAGLGIGFGFRKTLLSAAIAIVVGSVSEWFVWNLSIDSPRFRQFVRTFAPMALISAAVFGFLEWDRHEHPLPAPPPTTKEPEPENPAAEELRESLERSVKKATAIQKEIGESQLAIDQQRWDDARTHAQACLKLDPTNNVCAQLALRADEQQ